MNPVTFNDRFAVVLDAHPHSDKLKQINFAGWAVAPLFDYETTWCKEHTLLQEPMTLAQVAQLQWPFDTFRLAMLERDVPFRLGDGETATSEYRSRYVVKKHKNDCLDVLIWWRDHVDKRHDVVMHVFTYNEDGTQKSAASLCSKGSWDMRRIPNDVVHAMAGSAIASLASFALDCSLPTNHIAEVRPNQPGRSVEWLRARTRHTLITHGHPANKKEVAERERVVVDAQAELQRMSGARRGHWRTYKHDRYRFARGSTRWVKQTWCGPKEWCDAGGKQIYRVLEPVEEISDALHRKGAA